MPNPIIADSSSLFALERAGLIKFLRSIGHKVIIPQAVAEEIKKGKGQAILEAVAMQELKAKSLKKSRMLENTGIGSGEAQCCALANKLKLEFIVCDDRKFLRQRFFSNDKGLKEIKVLGFSYFLHIFYRKKLIDNVWGCFNRIIETNNWKRSEVQIANYTFLKDLGY